MHESLTHAPGGEIAELDRDYGRDEIRSIDILENRQNIHPVKPDYASIPFNEAFNVNEIYNKVVEEFAEVLESDPETGTPNLAIFAFYSQPNPDLSEPARHELDVADILAFLEARRAKPDNFLYYYRGEPDINGNVMSFCAWTDFVSAQAVRKGPFHEVAAKMADESYDDAYVQGHILSKVETNDNAALDLLFERKLKVGKAKAV